jgi:hypothetical protein
MTKAGKSMLKRLMEEAVRYKIKRRLKAALRRKPKPARVIPKEKDHD